MVREGEQHGRLPLAANLSGATESSLVIALTFKNFIVIL